MSTCVTFLKSFCKQTNTWRHGSKCWNSNRFVRWAIFNRVINLRVKYTHLHIHIFAKSLLIYEEIFIYLQIVVVMLYFSIAMFFCVNLENFLLWCPILQDNFMQLISTAKKNYNHCATITVHRRLDRLVLLNLIHGVIIGFFVFNPFLTTLELMLTANERACYNYY